MCTLTLAAITRVKRWTLIMAAMCFVLAFFLLLMTLAAQSSDPKTRTFEPAPIGIACGSAVGLGCVLILVHRFCFA
jgi:hypothetical protein